MSLNEIFCQDRVMSSLQKAFEFDRVGHAYIFNGDDGLGKFTTARAWAKALLCKEMTIEDRPDGPFHDSCGKCESCKVFEGDGHPDFKPIYKEMVRFTEKGKNKKTPVDLPKDVITEFLIDKVASKPMMSKRVVYVVSEAEKLNPSSQNALLKVLEEPPSFCCIILLCSRLEKMLPTTLSRCQLLRFGHIDEERIVEKLTEISVPSQEATYWARFSQSSLGRAISWASLSMEKQSCYEIKQQLVSSFCKMTLPDTLDLAEWIAAQAKTISTAWMATDDSLSKTDITRRAQKGLIMMIIAALNDVMKLNSGMGKKLINSDQSSEIEFLAQKIDAETAAARIEKCFESLRWIEASVNEKLIFEELLLNLAGCATISSSM